MSQSDTHFADTTVVYYRLHQHSLFEDAVRRAVGNGILVVSNFVRGEYIRGYVTGLIDLFYAIRAEGSVRDGISLFNSEMGSFHPRKVANALQEAANWLGSLEDSKDVKKTLRRLGEEIRRTLVNFDAKFPRRSRDPLECEFGVKGFPSETYSEQHILDFYEECERIREKPSCRQCEFRSEQTEQLRAQGIDLFSQTQRDKFAGFKGYVKQAKMAEKAVKSTMREPSCWYCDRMGDTIIALSSPSALTILTGDSQSFPTLASLLRKPLALIPSLKELRIARDQNRNP